ncbi:MAG: glycosyltransferase family 39 protein [Acidobacteria bacterium]|nr:glycosyltransferase family 39 protein [Acidobacteriota bacterium]MBI3654974.1 glycosyltransferase family 39 protein [Acidobacteriota bacterium]
MKRSDYLATAVLITVFLAMTAVSWQHWCNPVIDSGREMNQPLRLLRGETLYSDVYHLYGPFAPYFNAFLYRCFGVHLNTLYVGGGLAGLLLIAMVYWISRTLLPPFEALLATLNVVALCVFKQSGNYLAPYAYAAVYGALFDVFTLASLMRFLQSRRVSYLLWAGGGAGLAIICKNEFGIAAIAAGLTVIFLQERRLWVPGLARLAIPAALTAASAYAFTLSRVPWQLMVRDSYLFLNNVPPELVYFNKARLGLQEPLRALEEMGMAALALIGIGALVTIGGLVWAEAHGQTEDHALSLRYKNRAYASFFLASLGLAAGLWYRQLPLDRSPFRVTPLVLVLCTIYYFKRWLSAKSGGAALSTHERIVMVLVVYSLAITSRVFLRVPSGGAYGGFFLPIPMVLLVYLALDRFPRVLNRIPSAALTARRWLVALMLIVSVAVTAVTAFRYRNEAYYSLETPRGSMRVHPDVGRAFRMALDFIALHTSPAEPIFAAPEGSSLNFLADRPTPQRYEILTPGFLTVEAEWEAIRRLQASRTRYIFILNRSTTEFGPRAFGRDYCVTLMGWIQDNYRVVRVFGEASANAQIGARKFFIKVYELVDNGVGYP